MLLNIIKISIYNETKTAVKVISYKTNHIKNSNDKSILY